MAISTGNSAPSEIAVLSSGLWQFRNDLQKLTGCTPVRARGRHRRFETAADWGLYSRSRGLSIAAQYLAVEPGLLRSVKVDRTEPLFSLIVDREGLYYDTREPSQFESLVRTDRPSATRAKAAEGMRLLRELKLSIYNHEPLRLPAALALSARRRVLVVDQATTDPTVEAGSASAASFEAMLDAAIADNPGSEIVVRTVPRGFLGKSGRLHAAAGRERVSIVDQGVNPWTLLETVERVYVVTSHTGFEALIANRSVTCFGLPFYAGWGLTDDRGPLRQPAGSASIESVFAALYLACSTYFDPWDRNVTDFTDAAQKLAWLRDRFHENEQRAVCIGVTRWKRRRVSRFLEGPSGPPLFRLSVHGAIRAAEQTSGRIVTWATREPSELQARCRSSGLPLVRMEDGFLRSVGLGAAFVPPFSCVLDEHGIYYDPREPSDLERLLGETEFPPTILAEAKRVREEIVRLGVSKYNVGSSERLDFPSDRVVVLVPGQVEDDASVVLGSPGLSDNRSLLAAARRRHPDAFIVYKPHPDVEAGFRLGAVPDETILRFADRIVRRTAIAPVLDRVHHVETMTSLAGFEALLRGKSVTVHGRPFYAGWGLTEDLDMSPRRRKLGIDELVAGALILYPRYLDPISGLRCPAALLVHRLAERRMERRSAFALSAVRHLYLRLRYALLGPIARLMQKRRLSRPTAG